MKRKPILIATLFMLVITGILITLIHKSDSQLVLNANSSQVAKENEHSTLSSRVTVAKNTDNVGKRSIPVSLSTTTPTNVFSAKVINEIAREADLVDYSVEVWSKGKGITPDFVIVEVTGLQDDQTFSLKSGIKYGYIFMAQYQSSTNKYLVTRGDIKEIIEPSHPGSLQ